MRYPDVGGQVRPHLPDVASLPPVSTASITQGFGERVNHYLCKDQLRCE